MTQVDVGALAPLGLSTAAVTVYEQMLLEDNWSLASLPAQLGLERAAITTALDELVAGHLIVRTEDSPTMRVVSPQVALARLLDAQEGRLRQQQDELATARRATELLVARASEIEHARARTTVELLTVGTDVANRVSEALDAAELEVLTMLTILPSVETLAYAADSDAALLARGVSTRLLVLAGHLARSPELVEHVNRLDGLGAQVRVAATLPHRMIVVDGRVAVLPADLRNESGGAIVLRQPTLVSLSLDAFEAAWAQAQPIGSDAEATQETPGDDGWRPSQLQREVLSLLAAGEKDDAIARRLGISARTVRRLISELSDALAVNSRFQLAVVAARRQLV